MITLFEFLIKKNHTFVYRVRYTYLHGKRRLLGSTVFNSLPHNSAHSINRITAKMVVKVYISGISGNKEVKKRQQRVTMILDSKSITYDLVDITEPGKEDEKTYMQTNSKSKDGSKNALPPQIFNGEIYCGDYDDFDTANELDELDKFFDISNKNPPKELNGSNTMEETNKVENINEDSDTNEGVIKEKVFEEQPGTLTSDDEDSDNESLDTQNKLIDTTESINSVPLPDDTKVLLDIPEKKQELLSETEEEIEE